MIERILHSRAFLAYTLACATGLVLDRYYYPWPSGDLMLRLIAVREPLAYAGLYYTYTLLLFTTPYIVYSILFSGFYVLAWKPTKRIDERQLPPYPDPRERDKLSLVLGEVHDPPKPAPSANPYWLVIPERGLYTGIGIFGAIGASKTTGCMLPYTEQLIAFKAGDPAKRIGGLVLEVKGGFCHEVKRLLAKHGRTEDYVEVSLHGEYRYNPLFNDLDAYALAYNIASLLNNLFGKGKEPFWQQAYTNLVKFIIQLHKVAYDYVTLFDVYECAINRDLLRKRILEAEELIQGRQYLVIPQSAFLAHPELEPFGFQPDDPATTYKAAPSRVLQQALTEAGIEYEWQTENSPTSADPMKREILDAVKRWYRYDWLAIENKLRTSIVEGISVFLSLFDDNPLVKRAFCPPKECYDPKEMTILRVLIRWAAISLVLATVLFIAAGTTQIPSLRDYIAVFSALLLFTMVSVDPDLEKERAHPAVGDADSRTRSVAGFLYLNTVGFGALDVGRLHQSDSVPSALHLPALLVFAAALGLQA